MDILTELTSHAGFEKPKKKDKKPRSPKKITTMSHQETYINETIALIKRCYRVLVIMRGLPGSGKSTLARQIVKASLETDDFEPFIFSADDYFVVNGVYRYDPARLQDAHRYIQYQASEAMRKAISPVIIDNTNTQLWEMKPYAVRAVQCGYIIRIIEPMTPWAFNDKELARRNIHGVPRVKLKDMLERYEKNISTERLMQLLSLSYKNVKPPQLRAFPPIVSSYSDNKMVCDNSFKSDEAAEVVYNSDNDDICKIQTLSVDDMLSCNGFNAEVLEPCLSEWTSPYLQGETIPLLPEKDEEALASNVDKKEKSVCSNVDLSAWGVAEHALRSWELYTPISDEFVENTTPLNSEDEIKPELVDSETNTCKDDFALANGPEVLGIKILSTTNRDISANLPNIVLNKPRKKIMLDQSSWVTEDFLLDNLIGEDRGANLEQLSSIFPNTPKSYLSEILDKCKGNLNWAIDLLCEDKGQIAPEQEIPEPPSEPEIINSEDITDIEMVEVPKMIEDPPMTCNKVDNNVADGLLELKKKFEEGIHIAKEFYSEHVYKIKQARMNHTDAPQPSTSKTESFEMVTSETNGMSDSDTDISKSSDTRMSSSSDENEQEMVELNLGETLIGELENKLQEPSFVYPKGFQPIVQIPVNLARQLYAFYIESVYQQMDAQNEVLDAMLKEDEEFAKRLQQEEENQLQQKSTKTDDLKDIINEQYAMSLYQKDVDQWKNLTPDDLASKLTKQKLYEHFPHIDKNVLIEVWQAHGNNYKETVESILLSDPSCAVISGPGVFEPPLSDSLVQEMKEDYQRSQEVIIYVIILFNWSS